MLQNQDKMAEVFDSLPTGKNVPDLALFLDIDGTLAPIAPTPDQARIPIHTLVLVHALFLQLQGAVAIVSGRSIKDIDAMCAPYIFPAAALHGLEMRFGEERLVASAFGSAALEPARSVIQGMHIAYPNLVIEDKGLSIAVHYRQAPLMGDIVLSHLQALLDEAPEKLSLQQGKMVVELRLKGGSKGMAITHFMTTPAFAGRVPLFVGDDQTDEEGFRAVNALGGISIKIGNGESVAKHRFETIELFHDWLVVLVARLTTPLRMSA